MIACNEGDKVSLDYINLKKLTKKNEGAFGVEEEEESHLRFDAIRIFGLNENAFFKICRQCQAIQVPCLSRAIMLSVVWI